MVQLNKIKTETLLAAFTFLALIMLTAIQISWIIKAARMEEQNFNHRVSLAMINISDKIGQRAQSCNIMNAYLCGKECTADSRELKIAEIDTIIRKTLKNHQISLDYKFSIGDSLTDNRKHLLFASKCYRQQVTGLAEKDGIKLFMRFPGKNDFLLAQMKGWFILSLLFILFVAASFIITLRMFLREQAMVNRTTDFINNMVHEFQTPIANIRLASNLIRKQQPAPQRTTEYTDIILHESQKLEHHVEEILSLSGIGKQPGQMIATNVHELLQQLTSQFALRAEERGGSLKLDLNATRYILDFEKGHLQVMISNLIDNALKYNNRNPEITITTINRNDKLLITITDNGIGIPEKEQGAIFDKYYRIPTGDLHNVKGFGLGLTCVQRLARYYNGDVKVESKVGEGSAFTITIPIKHD